MHISVDDGMLPEPAAAGGSASGHFVYGSSPAMRAVERFIADIAPTDIPVLLTGESGTGKEMAALEIHRLSGRRNETFLKCNCSVPNAESLQARLRGSQNGSYDGPGTRSGTIFLDEVDLLDPSGQLAMLHSLPGTNGTSLDGCTCGRLICATTGNLEEAMRCGRFREDLYYRINGVCLRLPPLRHRREDIAILLEFFLKRFALLFHRAEPQLRPSTMDLLLGHSWPGNVRELENAARKIVVLGDEDLVLSDWSAGGASLGIETPGKPRTGDGPTKVRSLKEAAREASRKAERGLIVKALKRTRWNRKRTARDLQVSYKALLYKMKQLGLDGASESELAPEDKS